MVVDKKSKQFCARLPLYFIPFLASDNTFFHAEIKKKKRSSQCHNKNFVNFANTLRRGYQKEE